MMDSMTLGAVEAFILALGSLGLGMVMLIRGGGWTIDAAVYLARHIGISPLVVGFTVVAFGTSLPELIVSINANLHGSPGISIGNVLGSNIANILLVIGATAVIATLTTTPKETAGDLFMMIAMTALLAGLMMSGVITTAMGFAMLGLLFLYTFWQYRQALAARKMPEDIIAEPEFSCPKTSVIFLLAGLVFVAIGAEFLVRGATVGAKLVGVPEAVIGLSIIAIGTSLPELSTCLIAAMKKQTGIVLGNVIGSNFFNILMIVGATAAIKPIDIAGKAPQLVEFDIWVTLGVSVIFALILLLYRKVNRFLGILFLAAYVAYIIMIYALYLT